MAVLIKAAIAREPVAFACAICLIGSLMIIRVTSFDCQQETNLERESQKSGSRGNCIGTVR